jgi:hypothetical protein
MSVKNDQPVIKEHQLFLTTKELAYRWQVVGLTVERWRREGSGPQFFNKGRSVFYTIEEIHKYEESEKFKKNLAWKKSRKIHE